MLAFKSYETVLRDVTIHEDWSLYTFERLYTLEDNQIIHNSLYMVVHRTRDQC